MTAFCHQSRSLCRLAVFTAVCVVAGTLCPPAASAAAASKSADARLAKPFFTLDADCIAVTSFLQLAAVAHTARISFKMLTQQRGFALACGMRSRACWIAFAV